MHICIYAAIMAVLAIILIVDSGNDRKEQY